MDELAKLSDKTSKTIKRYIAKMPHIKYIGRGNNGYNLGDVIFFD